MAATTNPPTIFVNSETSAPAPTTFVLRDAGFGTAETETVTVISRSERFAPTLDSLPVIAPEEATDPAETYLALEDRLGDGSSYVRSFVDGGTAQFAVVPGTVPNFGTATYSGTAAIRVADAATAQAFDDTTGAASIAVNFGANSRVGTFSITDGTRTDSLGRSTPFTGGRILVDMAQSGRSDVTLDDFDGVAFDGDRIFARTAFGGPNAAEMAGVIWGTDDDTEVNVSFVGDKQ